LCRGWAMPATVSSELPSWRRRSTNLALEALPSDQAHLRKEAMSPLVYLLVLFVALGVSYGLAPVAIRLGKRFGLVAVPGGRRRHEGRIPRIGGLSLFPAFALATLPTLWVPTGDPLEIKRWLGVLSGMAVVWIIGLVDDAYELPAWTQLLGLAVAAGVAIGFDVFIEVFNHPLTDAQIRVDWYIMVPLTLFWLISMSSTMNVVDGLDGLAAGIAAIAALVLFIHMLRLEQYSVAILPLALLGCCLGFLPYNFGRARLFLGGGAPLLGFAVGALSIVAGAKVASALLVVWLPLVDSLWQVYSRWRTGRPIAQGDRGHLHFRLLDLGWPQSRIVLIYYAVTAVLGASALVVSSRLLKLVILGGAALLILTALALLARKTPQDASPTG